MSVVTSWRTRGGRAALALLCAGAAVGVNGVLLGLLGILNRSAVPDERPVAEAAPLLRLRSVERPQEAPAPTPPPEPAPEPDVEEEPIPELRDAPPEPPDLDVRPADLAAAPAALGPAPAPTEAALLGTSGGDPAGGRRAGVDRWPRRVGGADAAYPWIARRRGIEGWVVVRILVGRGGAVQDLEVLKWEGHPSFVEAVEEAVPGWRFEPARRDGRPVPVWKRFKVRFDLTD